MCRLLPQLDALMIDLLELRKCAFEIGDVASGLSLP